MQPITLPEILFIVGLVYVALGFFTALFFNVSGRSEQVIFIFVLWPVALIREIVMQGILFFKGK